MVCLGSGVVLVVSGIDSRCSVVGFVVSSLGVSKSNENPGIRDVVSGGGSAGVVTVASDEGCVASFTTMMLETMVVSGDLSTVFVGSKVSDS